MNTDMMEHFSECNFDFFFLLLTFSKVFFPSFSIFVLCGEIKNLKHLGLLLTNS